MHSIFIRIFGLVISLTFITPVLSAFADVSCNEIVNSYENSRPALAEKTRALIEEYRNSADPDKFQFKLAESYLSLISSGGSTYETLNQLIPPSEVLTIIKNHGMRLYQIRLNSVFEKAAATEKTGGLNKAKISKFISSTLENIVPKASIDERVSKLITEQGRSSTVIKRALGEMELKELQILVHGGNPLKPTPESLIGQYIKRTSASTLVYRFPSTPKVNDAYPNLGPEKLVISMSRTSAQVYHELFTRPEFLIHHHTSEQGTLHTSHNKNYGSYLDRDGEYQPEQSSEGTLMPHILLPSQEANRMLLISEMGASLSSLRESWKLCEGYSPKGGYDSCTHWFGNLPVGRKFVKDAKHPGKIDNYANNDVSELPQIARFGTYNAAEIAERFGNQNSRKVALYTELLPLVWNSKGGKANMSLSEMLGSRELEANLNGEYANPGYVALRLMGNVSAQWVPFVFRASVDHQAPIDADFDPRIKAY